jgi:hypothetical protein
MPRSSSTAVPSKIDNRRQRGASPPRGRIADSSSRKAVSFSSARTTKLDRCDARQQIPNICPPNRRLRTQPPTTVDVAPRSLTVSARRLFREEPPNDASFLLVLDAREQLCPQLSNRFWFIERQLLIHLAALKVTGLAAGLEYRPDVRSEGGPFCHYLGRGGGLIHGSVGFRKRIWLCAITCSKTNDENHRQHQHAFWHSCMLLP